VTGDKEFTGVFSRMIRGWSAIDSFRQVAIAGIPYATKIVETHHEFFVRDLATSGKLSEFIIGIKDPSDLLKTARWLRESLTKQAVENATASVDAASIVFGHTILDDALGSFIEMTGDLAGGFWKERVRNRKIELGMLGEGSVEVVIAKAVAKEIASIRRNESLIKKCDLLHSICKPAPGTPSHPSYKFSADMVTEIDKQRQDIVHGELLGAQIGNVKRNLDYLRETWMYFFLMMHENFGLRIDPSEMSGSRGKEGPVVKPSASAVP
jgi:hypothetical protein